MSTESKITIDIFKTVTKAIAHSVSLDVMASHLTQLLVAALDIKGCAVFFLDPDSKQLEILASFGLSPAYMTKGPILAHRSIAANLEGKPVIVADVTGDSNVQYPEEAKKEGIAAILSIPIIFSKEVLGALRLYHHEVWHVSEQDVDSLRLLGENIGLAVVYTRLLNAVRSVSEVINVALPPELMPLIRM
jgi:signal transduction protein with GAF and PtsI domain